MYSNSFWDKIWSRKCERYNRHHQEIWNHISDQVSPEAKIVDLGCGPGVMYKNKDVDLTGVDWSEEALKQAKLNCPNGTYIQADATASGLPSGQFDFVIACGLLDYFDNWDPVIIEAKRLLKEGGTFYATLLNGFLGHDWMEYPRVTGNWHLVTFDKKCAR